MYGDSGISLQRGWHNFCISSFIMSILFIPNWNVRMLKDDDSCVQAPDKVVEGKPYWFFRHFDKVPDVTVLDRGPDSWFRSLEQKAKFYVRQPWQAVRQCANYDLVISHGAQSGLVFELLSSWTRHRCPHLMIDVGCLNGGRINRTETPLIRYALRQAPHIVTHNSHQLDFYRQYYPKLAEKARFIPFGVDIDYFAPQPHSDSRTMVAFGHRKRDYETLCQAFPRGEGWTLQVIGNRSLQLRYGCDDIQFYDAMPLNVLMEHIAQSEAVVVPLPELPYSYGQMTLLQSMAMARPVICTLTTGTMDYVGQADCVETVRPSDVTAMRDALRRMMQRSNDERRGLGIQCRHWVEANFSEARMAHQLEQYIDQILQS